MMWILYFIVFSAVLSNVTFWANVSIAYHGFVDNYTYEKPRANLSEKINNITRLIVIVLILSIPIFNIIIAVGSMYVDKTQMVDMLIKEFNAKPKK